jgi:hypothetical protein
MTWPGLTKDFEQSLIMFYLSVCQMTKKERKKYGLLPPKIAESDIVSLRHGLCGSGGSIYNKETSQHTLSASLKLSKPQISQQHPIIQDLFHNTWLARYPRPQFIVFDNGG